MAERQIAHRVDVPVAAASPNSTGSGGAGLTERPSGESFQQRAQMGILSISRASSTA
jgi:hypothetical protein